ncbi:MAG: LLM class flavin-dependent oxidoreductase [Xanthomonadales bacterium]|nr:LLM class flavin-dependent oxidoreductase [Xanthomonadales bacterium]ODU95200.1 MAG: alkane 1-monooxygenase [Rhodanobacter sp. SCN 66-43]OJY82929.1 MAG: alkane 1-monooxygenase [Xanthomonadales bacterium 66-474]
MIPFSFLDLCPITEGGSASESLAHTVDVAQHAERWGFNRFWMAEHHGMPGIASAATAVLIGHVAGATSRIRVGAGGIMLPNHSPLVIAEQFGTLEALYPGRIDLGLGRAPGSDQATARALRRNLDTDPDAFPRDVLELIAYFEGRTPVRAVPGEGQAVPIWILGSSLFGAQLAAMLGLPYAFASHFAPAQMMDAIAVYRAQFKPSRFLQRPHVMLGYNVFAADTDDEARYLATSWQQSFVNLRLGHPGRLPPPVEGYAESLPPQGRKLIEHVLSCSAIGSPHAVANAINAFIERTGADELILTSNMHDHAARLRSIEIVAGLIEEPAGARSAG